MGNLFLGFPVARAKIADMIATSAPPSVHHTQHEDGGSDEIDATGLTGAGGGGGGIGTILNLSSAFEALTGYAQAVAGTGVLTVGVDGATLDTGTTASSQAKIDKWYTAESSDLTFDRDRVILINAEIRAYTSKNGGFYLGRWSIQTGQYIGFKVIDGILYGTVRDGVAETTALLQTISTSAFNVVRNLRAVFTAGVKCEFYVDGVLLGTITTGLPSGVDYSDSLIAFDVINNALAERKKMIIHYYNLQYAL